jgi:hypothetical protein
VLHWGSCRRGCLIVLRVALRFMPQRLSDWSPCCIEVPAAETVLNAVIKFRQDVFKQEKKYYCLRSKGLVFLIVIKYNFLIIGRAL